MQSQVPLTSAGWLQEILTWAGSTPADCTPCEWVSASGSTRSNSDEPSCGLSSSGSHILWIGSLKKDTPLNFRTSSSYTGLRFQTKLHTHCQRLQFELQVNMLQKELSIALNKHLNSCRPAPRLTHPLCCSLRAIMQKTPPPSVSILHSHAERLKPAVTLVDINQGLHLTPKAGIFTLQRPHRRAQTYWRPVPATPRCLAPSCLRDSHPILHTCTIFQFNKLKSEMSHPRSAPRAFLIRFLTPFVIYLSFFCNLNESLLYSCSH